LESANRMLSKAPGYGLNQGWGRSKSFTSHR
jgi:hypothetical protein